MKKKFGFKFLLFFTLIVSVLVFSLAGCSRGDDSGRDTSGEILFWLEEVGANPEQLNKYVEYFNANNGKGYTLKYELKTSVTASLKEAKTAGIGPDIVSFPRWETATSYNLVKDLAPRFSEEGVKMSDYYSEAVNEITIGDKIYGVPTDVDAWGIWANKDIVDAYNTKNPDTKVELPLKTWDELKSAAQKLTSAPGGKFEVMGFDSEGFRGQVFTTMLTSGVNMVNTSTTPSTINFPEPATTQAFEYMYSMIHELNIWGAKSNSMDLWTGGKIAMQFGSTGFKQDVDVYLKKENAMNMVFMGNPAKSATEGKISGIIGGFSYAIPNIASVKVDKSWEVIQIMLSDASLLKYCELAGIMPAKNSLMENDYVKNNPTFATMKEILPTYSIRPQVKGYPTMENSTLFGEMDKLIAKKPANKDAYISTMISAIKTNGNQIFTMAQSI